MLMNTLLWLAVTVVLFFHWVVLFYALFFRLPWPVSTELLWRTRRQLWVPPKWCWVCYQVPEELRDSQNWSVSQPYLTIWQPRTFISIFTLSQYFCSYYAGTTANCPRHGADREKYQTRQSQETGPRRPPCRSFRWVKVKSVSGKQYQYLMELYCITSCKYICIHYVRLNCSIYRPWCRWPWGQDPGLPGGRCHWRGQVSSTSVFYYMYLINRCGSNVCTFKYHTHL